MSAKNIKQQQLVATRGVACADGCALIKFLPKNAVIVLARLEVVGSACADTRVPMQILDEVAGL
jgi:hypothetical protein